jgi:16S rRNA (cytosine967-C5)-methyltransferase
VVELDAPTTLPPGMPGVQALAGAHSDKLHGPGDEPAVQLWPHRHGTDAMFLALLRRTA